MASLIFPVIELDRNGSLHTELPPDQTSNHYLTEYYQIASLNTRLTGITARFSYLWGVRIQYRVGAVVIMAQTIYNIGIQQKNKAIGGKDKKRCKRKLWKACVASVPVGLRSKE